MPKSRTSILVEKSIAAMLAAVQVYNSPMHPYREDAFAILALNAWELLLKAKLLADNRNKISSILEYTNKIKKDGTKSAKQIIKRNRAGNPQTISFHKTIGLLDAKAISKLDAALKANLDGLIELRDNAVHFANTSFDLAKSIQELGTACLQNYALLARDWFNCDLTSYNIFLMPLAFFGKAYSAKLIDLNVHESNFLKYLGGLDSAASGTDPKSYNALLKMEVRFARSASPLASEVRITSDVAATPIFLSEEQIRERYPWDYKELTDELKNRYTDFRENTQYHDLRRPLLEDAKFAKRRFLDQKKAAGMKKDYYSKAIVNIFDKHYTRK